MDVSLAFPFHMVGLVFCYVGPGGVPCGSPWGARSSGLWEFGIESARGHGRLGTAGLAAVDLAGRRVGYRVAVVQVRSRSVALHRLPAFAVVDFHPVVLAILNLASALESLREQLAQVVVVGSVLEAEVAHVAEVLVEFL